MAPRGRATHQSPDKLREGAMIDNMAQFINKSLLANEDSITAKDIERCHPIGRKVGTRKPQIIVKFASYQIKSKVFASKTKLKGHPDRVFLTEDLTSNQNLVRCSIFNIQHSNFECRLSNIKLNLTFKPNVEYRISN